VPVRETNFAKASREPSSTSANHADGGGHGENAFEDETDILSIDDLMTREADVIRNGFLRSQCGGWSTHLLPTDDVPISRSSPSTNGDADDSEPSGTVCPKGVLRCPDSSFASREIYDGCNFASCPRAHPDAGHLFPAWGSDGNIVCVDGTSPPSWTLGSIPQGD